MNYHLRRMLWESSMRPCTRDWQMSYKYTRRLCQPLMEIVVEFSFCMDTVEREKRLYGRHYVPVWGLEEILFYRWLPVEVHRYFFQEVHSRFGILLNADEDSTCIKLRPDHDVAGLIKRTKLIIWDETPMTKHYFEALDRSLRDVMCRPYTPFRGLVVVFGRDFRQILPVVPGGSRSDIVNAAIYSSRIWDSCEVLKRTKSMRLQVFIRNYLTIHVYKCI